MAINTNDEELQGWLWSPTGNQVALVFEAKTPFTNSATNRQGRVSLYGRQIATFHPSQHLVCLDGVNPGSVVAHGQTIQEAQDRFRDEVTYILSDIDSSCGSSIEMFRKEVANFMEQTDVSLADKWNELAEAHFPGVGMERTKYTPVTFAS